MSTPDRASSRARALALEETAEDLYEHAPCGYLSTLPDGEIIKINTTLLGWLGLNRGDVVGKWRFEDLLSVGGRIYHETHFSPLLRMQGEVRSIALDLVTTAGTRLPVLVNAVLKTGAEDEPLLVRMVVVEVRDRRSYERELLRARRAADEQTRLRQRWVEASGEITTALLAGAGPGEALGLVARRAAELTGASGALITTPVTTAAHGEAPPVRVMVAVGFDDRYPAGTPLPVGGTVLGAVARTGAPHAVDDLVLAPGHAGEGSGLAVLMRAGEETSGVLVVSGVDAGADSIRDGLSILASFADQAALVLRYAESQRALRELDVLADRERIAADLHDHVLQRLFALGLGLQAVHARLASSDAARRVDEAVDQIDGIVRDIRSAIFDLHNSRAGGELAARVRAAATGMAADTDVEPVVRVSGEVEAVPEDSGGGGRGGRARGREQCRAPRGAIPDHRDRLDRHGADCRGRRRRPRHPGAGRPERPGQLGRPGPSRRRGPPGGPPPAGPRDPVDLVGAPRPPRTRRYGRRGTPAIEHGRVVTMPFMVVDRRRQHVQFSVVDLVATCSGGLYIPFERIVGARVMTRVDAVALSPRSPCPGSWRPGRCCVGSWSGGERRQLWGVHRGAEVVVIYLSGAARFTALSWTSRSPARAPGHRGGAAAQQEDLRASLTAQPPARSRRRGRVTVRVRH